MNLIKRLSIKRSLAGITVATLLCSQASAQIHHPELVNPRWLTLAEEQYQQGHYAVAAQSAAKFLGSEFNPVVTRSLTEKDKAQYYLALSLLKIDAPHGIDSARSFIDQTANPAYKERMSFALAQYYFRHDQLTEAIPYYETASIANLSNREIADAKFELAYCYFNSRQFDKAEPLFATIKEIDGQYTNAGNYYYGLLAYNKGDYAGALKSFQRIAELPDYKNIVPYYVAEIRYFMGDKQKALDEARRLIKRPEKLYYDNELHLLAAQCLFEQEKFAEALPYFEHYYNNSTKIRKEELYEIAYCYYQTNNYKNAINSLKDLSGTQDSLGQTAMYLLGDCYLKTGDKKSARSAFSTCADLNFNAGQREASLLLAGKLAYEQGYPDEATMRLRQLLTDYPQSQYASEAKTLFSDLLTKTSNYAEAYEILQNVPNHDANYRRVLQKAAYGYAMQQLQNGDYAAADKLLGTSAEQAEDPQYLAAANFWRGDIAYRNQRFQDAVNYSQEYLSKPDAANRAAYISSPATPQHAYLNMGYASMKLEDFAAAQDYFAKAQKTGNNYSSALAGTAVLREADAAFMRKQYSQAIALYDKVIASNSADVDYARFQKAILLGLQDKDNDKIALLQTLVNRTPASAYADDARYEIAVTQIDDNKYQQAITMLQALVTPPASQKFAAKAWIKTGFAYQQMDNDDKAIESYRHVVTDYPSSEERTAALEALKSLYIENNQPAAYAQLLQDNNLPAADANSLDSTFYAAGEAQFASAKYDKAVQSFEQYLKAYPNGAFAVKAHYYKAESHAQLKDYKSAIGEYNAVLTSSWSEYSENSARRAAALALQTGDFATALKDFQLFRNTAMTQENLQIAYSGMLRSSFGLKDYATASLYADTLQSVATGNEAMTTEATFYKAQSLMLQNNTDAALPLYQQLASAKNSAIAAESRYHIAEILLLQNKLKEAENAAGQNIQQSAGNDYWIVKSYILLSDILVKEKDYFNAKATLQSIVKNTKNTELKAEATKKLEAVKALEKKQSKLSEE